MEGVDHNLALAAEVFDQFCSATTLRSILGHFRHLCDLLQIRPTNFNQFYPKLKAKLRSWKAQALWNKFDKRASHKCYNRSKACQNLRVLVIGAGPCGLRSAIEAQLLGAKVVVVEKRDRITRNNVLHLWPFVIHDLRALGAKKFFGRFCAGAIDHISIRQLQCILLKVSCLLGIEIHEGVGFEHLIAPHQDPQTNEMVGWRAATSPADHPASQYEFNALIGADGKRNTLDGFKRKEFRGKLAIAITANFINRHTEAEARVEEISGVAFIFNQKFFKELTAETGIDLENIVYYKDDTHYFVMTAKKQSLIEKGVILNDCQDTARLLSPENVDKTALMEYAREAADFSTNGQLPCLEFAVNHYGQPDVAMFDFTSMYAAENASRMAEVAGHRLFIALVGDSLLEPFWPTGSGCARGFLSSMDACWALRSWCLGAHPLEVIAERESIYRLLGQTTPENLQRDLQSYTLDPHSRYPNLNSRCVLPIQVRNLFSTDDPESVDKFLKGPSVIHPIRDELPKKKRKRECHPDTLLHWLKRQIIHYESVPPIEDLTLSFKSGLALCAIIHRYRPHLIDFTSLNPEDIAKNNQLAFDILEREAGIPPVMTGEEMAECVVPDRLNMLSYLSQVYEAFRGEIPHIKHPKLEETDEDKHLTIKSRETRIRTLSQLNSAQKISLLSRIANKPPRKRRSHISTDRENRPLEELRRVTADPDKEFSGRVKDLEAKLRGTHTDKKPKDLLRAIGKIEKSDWNVKQIEKKIEENRMGRSSKGRTEKVPKWSKEQFEDKFTAVEKKLKARSNEAGISEKYMEIDDKMKSIEKRIKDGFRLEQGQRGANKVSAMAAHLATINKQPEPQIVTTGKPAVLAAGGAAASEMCHFCNKRVYLMERLSAEGRFFHRSCFKCQYCSTSLRLGNYTFDRDGKYGSRFYCVQHYGLPGTISRRQQREERQELLRTPVKPEKPLDHTIETVDVATPERAEFENLSDCIEVEEDEWTDRNFGLSATDTETDQDSSSSSSSEGFAEAEDGGLDPEETLRLAQDWTRKYASSHYSNSEDETSDSETEEEDEAKKERGPRPPASDSGSETEVPSEDDYSSSNSSASEDENSATEISTDSEFEHDGTIPTIPDIVISETVRKGHIEAPRHVQLVSRQMNGKIIPQRGDLNLDLKRIDDPQPKPISNINNNERLKPLINPNRGDYLLNRTQSTEGIASKISLELKKKYLLGSAGMAGNIRKSGSAVTLDTKFKSLIDQISEQQKLLNPAPVPSPTMQAFLQGADKLKTSPVLLEKKILPLKDFKHVCSLREKEVEKETKVEKKEEEEVRPRSPVHETSILVPEFPRNDQKEKEMDSDSLSSDMSTSDEEDEDDEEEEESHGSMGEGKKSVTPPKLEIHNSRGELMEEEIQLDSLNIPDVCQAEPQKDKLDLVPSTETGFTKVITVPSDENKGQVLKQVSTPAELFVSKEEGSDASSPPSPSLKDDITLGLTETELSDWARDEDGVVSESFDDLEYNINPQTMSYRKHHALRNKRNARGAAAKIARTEDFDDDFTHICGKDKPHGLHNLENLEFMDTTGESSDEGSSATNQILNRGYIQLVNPEDDDLPTPVVEAVNYCCLETSVESKEDLDSKFGESTDTTTSEPTTIKDSPLDPHSKNVMSNDIEKLNDDDLESYLEKIQEDSTFANVKSTLDLRKPRKNRKSPPDSLDSTICADAPKIPVERPKSPPKEKPDPPKDISLMPNNVSLLPKSYASESRETEKSFITPKLGLNSPTTHRKLEQLNKERAKQKDLIHEMVMNKLIAQGKSPTERRQRRSVRSSPKFGGSSPQPKERPKSEMFITPVAPPPIRERALTVSTARQLTARSSPVASSLPDIHRACSTPGIPSPLTVPNLRGMREQARAKFKMMSDEELGLSPEDKIKKFKLKIQKHLQEAKLPSPSHSDKLEINKKSKEERKKSIIQAVSDFFHKKSPTSPKPSSHMLTKSHCGAHSRNDKDAPPIPPPPLSYNPSQVVDDSQSEEETQSGTFAGMDSLQRKSKLNRRQVRQAQSKRLRMAQEVQRELEELEVKQKELEAKGVAVEKALRGEESGGSMGGSESELLGEWLRLMRERSEARRKEKQLVIRGQEIELEHRHARLQAQLTELMASSAEGSKTSEEVALEGRILREMLEIVERRNSLQAQLEAEKQRHCEEDKDFEAQMLAKGIQFQPKQ